MRIVTDDHLSVAWRTFRIRPPRLSMTLFVKASYTLLPGKPAARAEAQLVSGDLFVDDDPAKSLLYPSDLAPWKPRADVVLLGSAHAPGGQPVTALRVAMQVGKINKSLGVVGDRVWQGKRFLGVTASDPQPFVTMPLTWEHALGGPKDKRNPVGRGRDGEGPLPNVEIPGKLIHGPGDRVDPAGFAPIPAAWPPRCERMGTYKGSWKKERWPWYPDDFDWSHFCAAPLDQQVEGYLRGDESILLENLHPEHPLFQGEFPRERARAVVRFDVGEGAEAREEYREVPLRLDTAILQPDENKLTLIWRGQTDAPSMKLTELQRVFACAEKMSDDPRPLEALVLDLKARLEKENEDAGGDVQEQLDAAAKKVEEEKAKAEEEAAKQKQMAIDAGVDPALLEPKRLRRYEQITQSRAGLAAMIAALLEQGKKEEDTEVVRLKEADGHLERVAKDIGADRPPPTREEVEGLLKSGAALTGLDLSGLDLTGLSLAGVDAGAADFTDANLRGVNLSGAKLARARMNGADLGGANLSAAVLDDVDLVFAKLEGARFAGASLNRALLIQKSLAGADFSGAKAEEAELFGSDLSRANFAGAALTKCNFLGCDITGADFRRAKLVDCTLEEVKAPGAKFTFADITRIRASRTSNFTGADFRKASGDGALFRAATLDEADFSGAILTRSMFAESTMRRARFVRVHAAGSDFSDSLLEDAVMAESNFFQCSFDRARMIRTVFDGCNMYEASFFESINDNASFAEANLRMTLLE